MQTGHILAIGLLAAASPTVMLGDTFRCGNVLVSQDSTTAEILSRCGSPSHKEASEVQPTVRRADGTLQQLPPVRTEVWTYDRGPNAFAMRVTIVDGKVKAMDVVK